VKPNEIDVFAFTVLRDLEQIDETQETRLSRQLWSDIREADRLDRIYNDFAFFHTVPAADFDVWARPYPDAAGDFSATNSVTKTLAENHYADSTFR
jgi:hypothetical protein